MPVARTGRVAGPGTATRSRAAAGVAERVASAASAAGQSRVGRVIVRTLRTGAPGFEHWLARLEDRGEEQAGSVEGAVRAILDQVRRGGDRALRACTRRLDGVDVPPRALAVDRGAMEAAFATLPRVQRAALRLAARRIRDYHRHQLETSFRFRDRVGVVLGQEIRPLRRVGLYVPGGAALYPSSVLMNAIPARVAGVAEVVAVTPPHPGGEPAALLAAGFVANVDTIFRAGGAQAIAALTWGTATVARVDKIVGPGNRYVATAKKLVAGRVGIDMIAGPSEVVVIADASARADLIAADLLAQAEHGPDSTAICLTPSVRLAAAVERALAVQLAELPRAALARRSLRDHGTLVVTRDVAEAVEIANRLAPEHLELAVAEPRRWLAQIRAAGAVFLGHASPEAFGDYLAGPNHVLPTGGTARFASPLGVYDFLKRTSVIEASPAALRRLGPTVATLAAMEGLDAHGRAVTRRLTPPAGAAPATPPRVRLRRNRRS